MAGIHFSDEAAEPSGGTALVVRVGDVASRAELFDSLATQLHFPDYFGQNWDALSECLRDLSWVDARSVVIQHDVLPDGLGHDDLRTYLEVLRDCTEDWKPGEQHELTAVFPVGARRAVESALG